MRLSKLDCHPERSEGSSPLQEASPRARPFVRNESRSLALLGMTERMLGMTSRTAMGVRDSYEIRSASVNDAALLTELGRASSSRHSAR